VDKGQVHHPSARVPFWNIFGVRVQDSPTPKTLTTYLGLLYNI
jgi:hypothetical protein